MLAMGMLWVAYHGYTHYGQVGLRYMAGGLAALRISPPQLSTSASMLKKVATPSHLVITPPPPGSTRRRYAVITPCYPVVRPMSPVYHPSKAGRILSVTHGPEHEVTRSTSNHQPPAN